MTQNSERSPLVGKTYYISCYGFPSQQPLFRLIFRDNRNAHGFYLPVAFTFDNGHIVIGQFAHCSFILPFKLFPVTPASVFIHHLVLIIRLEWQVLFA